MSFQVNRRMMWWLEFRYYLLAMLFVLGIGIPVIIHLSNEGDRYYNEDRTSQVRMGEGEHGEPAVLQCKSEFDNINCDVLISQIVAVTPHEVLCWCSAEI